MLSPNKLLTRVRKDFPHLQFEPAETFAWSPDQQTITYADEPRTDLLLLHELSHALLGHKDYSLDIELLRLESAAWDYAKGLANQYNVPLDDDLIEDNLDSYRDWLHARSACPNCQQIGIQNQKNTYSCLNCRYSWGVNDAKQCQLRRTRLQGQDQPVSAV